MYAVTTKFIILMVIICICIVFTSNSSFYEIPVTKKVNRYVRRASNESYFNKTKEIKTIEDCSETLNIDVVDYVIPLLDPYDPALNRTLRSFEKYGLLDFIRDVYIITNDNKTHAYILKKYKNLKVVSMDDISYPYSLRNVKHIAWKKMFLAPYINDLSANYIMGPDDTILNHQYRSEFLFGTNKKRLMYAHSFGSSRTGDNLGFQNIAPNHGPNVLNKCAMKYVILKYKNNNPAIDPISVCIGMLYESKMIKQIFSYHDRRYKNMFGIEYFSECHTNGLCYYPKFDDLFVNIQGNGISREYGKNKRIEKRFTNWFAKTFPKPSRFEYDLNKIFM